MVNVFIIVGLIAYILCTTIKLKWNMHMLQLNSYRNERYLKWTNRNLNKVFDFKEFLPLIGVIFISVNQINLGLSIFCLIYLALFVVRFKTKEKKKFVFTKRIYRLIVTLTVIYTIAIFLLLNYSTIAVMTLILTLLNILSFIIVLLCNTINLPIEKAINNYYYKDAYNKLNGMKNIKVIGITGSYGKTSTKQVVNKILSKKFNVLVTPESYNTPMGVIKTIRMYLKPTHQIFIVEMGAKSIGDVKEICDLVSPQMGILTSIGPQHLESFKTIENVRKAKFELIESLPEDGMGFMNIDDENIKLLPKAKANVILYGAIDKDNNSYSYYADDIQFSSEGSTFTVHKYDGTKEVFKTKLLGRHNIYNILSGAAVASELGMTLKEISYAVYDLKPVEHRLQLRKNQPGITIIDDAFNSNPVGANSALEVLKNMKCKMRILITPGMIELGDKEFELNKEFGMKATECCDYIILVGAKQTKPIQEGLIIKNYNKENYYVAKNLNEALSHLRTIAKEDSVVLLENDLPDDYNE